MSLSATRSSRCFPARAPAPANQLSPCCSSGHVARRIASGPRTRLTNSRISSRAGAIVVGRIRRTSPRLVRRRRRQRPRNELMYLKTEIYRRDTEIVQTPSLHAIDIPARSSRLGKLEPAICRLRQERREVSFYARPVADWMFSRHVAIGAPACCFLEAWSNEFVGDLPYPRECLPLRKSLLTAFPCSWEGLHVPL
jgi:hypothetical protein